MSEEKEVVASVKKGAKVKESTVDKSKQQLIYFGPSLKNLQQYQIFRGELPEHVKRYISLRPILQNLFIAPKDLPAIQRNILVKGTKENQLFELALSATKGGIVSEL